MKRIQSIRAVALFSIILLAAISLQGQCPNGVAPKTITYDSTVVGNGYDDFHFEFPQFDPNLGTLIGVNLQTDLTLKYSFQLENDALATTKYNVRITRDDLLTYPGGSDGKPASKSYGPYTLQGSDGVSSSGNDYVEVGPVYPFRNLITSYDLNSNLAGFLGNGSAAIDYSTNSLVNALGGIYTRFQGQAFDTIKFSISYSYCKTAFLPAEILQFSANRINSADVDLRWVAPNDQEGTKYAVEKSADGRNYTQFESITSTSNISSNYQARYSLKREDNKKLFFRIRETGPDTEVKYSQVKIVSIPDNIAGEMKVYPTVSSGNFNISFQDGAKEDWVVSVYSMGGNLMQQSSFAKTNFIRYSAKTPLKPGIYFVVAENTKTKETQKSKIIIQ